MRVWSLPLAWLLISLGVAIWLVGDVYSPADYFRAATLAASGMAAVATAFIFWRIRDGIDRLPPMALAVLLAGSSFEVYQNVGMDRLVWYASPLLMVSSLMVLAYLFVKYGDR